MIFSPVIIGKLTYAFGQGDPLGVIVKKIIKLHISLLDIGQLEVSLYRGDMGEFSQQAITLYLNDCSVSFLAYSIWIRNKCLLETAALVRPGSLLLSNSRFTRSYNMSLC